MAKMTVYQSSRIKAACVIFGILAVLPIATSHIRHNGDGWTPAFAAVMGLYLLIRAMNDPTQPEDPSS